MKKKFLVYGILPVLGVGVLGAHLAAAQGLMGGTSATAEQVASRQSTMFQSEATLLGIGVDEVKAAWAKGETLQQIAQDHGITKDQLQQKLKDARQTQVQAQLQTLVTQGVITQAQADARLAFLQSNMGSKGGRGFRGGLGF